MEDKILKILMEYTKLGHDYKGGDSDIVIMFDYKLDASNEEERKRVLTYVAKDIVGIIAKTKNKNPE